MEDHGLPYPGGNAGRREVFMLLCLSSKAIKSLGRVTLKTDADLRENSVMVDRYPPITSGYIQSSQFTASVSTPYWQSGILDTQGRTIR